MRFDKQSFISVIADLQPDSVNLCRWLLYIHEKLHYMISTVQIVLCMACNVLDFQSLFSWRGRRRQINKTEVLGWILIM